jgi:predicted transcriptional regulator
MQYERDELEDAFASDDVEQRVYGTILQTREPTTASAIADSVDCDPKTARKYLGWFETLGIVTRHDGHPATYERNDAYFEWRRINQLAANHSVEDLQDRVRELTTRISEYEATYDAASDIDDRSCSSGLSTTRVAGYHRRSF